MVEWIDLNFSDRVTIILMNLPIKLLGQWMHESREKLKMDLGGGQFLEKCALEFVEIAWACYYHPYSSPHETTLQMDSRISIKFKNNYR